MVRKAVAAGGQHAMDPQDHGFMYGWSFYDLDGYHWEVMWMDPGAVRIVALALLIALSSAAFVAAETPRVQRGTRTRGLIGGWGHAWRFGVPGWNKTTSTMAFGAFHPRMGWFVADWLELYGEATLLLYGVPDAAVSAGLGGIAARHHFRTTREWMPYATFGAGILWTSLTVPEIDRIFNFQLFYGAGVRQVRARGPGLVLEFRNHHISNAGTAPSNLGVNAATILAGVEWTLRR